MLRLFLRPATVCLCLIASGCAAATPTNPIEYAQLSPPRSAPAAGKRGGIHQPALVVISYNGILKYYPITPQGGRHPQDIAKIPGLVGASSMVANGRTVAVVQQSPARVVLYDIATKAKQLLPDPYGVPIDIAVDKNANLYTVNEAGSSVSTVTRYPANTSQPERLTCRYLARGVAIAADNEGNVFVNGYGQSGGEVVEIPNGPNGPQPQKCKRLALQPEEGYAAGLAVDPKTDDLIVLDDPGACSGGIEGQLTIYPKPYKASTGRSVDLNGHCVGLMRLDATSRTVFALDRLSASGQPFVIQRSYPGGSGNGAYLHHNISGFTTIPNTLPN